MPRYEYRCRACGATFELSRPMREASDPCACPEGHDDTVKLLSTVAVGGRAVPSGPRWAAVAEAAAVAGPAAVADGPAAGDGLPDERYYTEIREAAARFADAVAGADETGPVPTCPDWTVRQLTAHLGRVHRWAAVIVTRRLDGPISFRDVPDGALPDDMAARTAWLNAGAAWVADAVRAGGQDKVWMLSGLVTASRWARRMAHETAMHAVDAQLATGQEPQMATDIAADGIDERLDLIAMASGDALLLPEAGQSLHVHATDEAGLPGGLGEWLIRQTTGGITITRGHDRADVAVRGPAADLVLLLQNRRPADTPGVEVLGERPLLEHWLAKTSF